MVVEVIAVVVAVDSMDIVEVEIVTIIPNRTISMINNNKVSTVDTMNSTLIEYEPTTPTVVFQDNMSSIQIANGTADISPRTRHYAMRYFYVKQAIEEHSVVLQYIATQDHTADILTKQPTTVHLFQSLRAKLMNCADTPLWTLIRLVFTTDM